MSLRVSFSRSLYLPEAVEAAAAAYAALAPVAIEPGGNDITAVVETDDRDLVDELCNHALFETISRRRGQPAGEPRP
jgi:hypothetical protein